MSPAVAAIFTVAVICGFGLYGIVVHLENISKHLAEIVAELRQLRDGKR